MPDGREAWESVVLPEGTVGRCEPFPGARKPAYRSWVDFGPPGVLASSAQLTALCAPEGLVGRQVVCAVSLGERRVGPFVGQCPTTGFDDGTGAVVPAVPDRPVPDGARLY
jgi:tRNA-binding protein